MTKIISVSNQKGGVGKTTTTVNLAAALLKKGYSVLCVDFDPQANMSEYLGFDGQGKTISELMQLSAARQPFSILEYICKNDEGIEYIPADINLAGADQFLAQAMAKEKTLHRILRAEALSRFDFILLDCLPSLGVLLTNSLVACHEILIPVQTQKFAMDGLDALVNIVMLVREDFNPTLGISGILPTFTDNTNVSILTLENLQNGKYKDFLLSTSVPKRQEAVDSTVMQTSLVSNNKSFLGRKYVDLADELLERWAK